MLDRKKSIEEILREIGEKQWEFQKGMKELQESQRKTEEFHQETEKVMRDLRQRFNQAHGDFTNKWGDFMQSLIEGDLLKLLNLRGIVVKNTYRSSKARRKDRSLKWEYDLIAANGREVVVVEVKTKLKSGDVDYFLKKLADFRNCNEAYRNKTVYGLVAYLEGESAGKYAQKNGLFTIEALGATEVATITNAQDFKPKAF